MTKLAHAFASAFDNVIGPACLPLAMLFTGILIGLEMAQ